MSDLFLLKTESQRCNDFSLAAKMVDQELGHRSPNNHRGNVLGYKCYPVLYVVLQPPRWAYNSISFVNLVPTSPSMAVHSQTAGPGALLNWLTRNSSGGWFKENDTISSIWTLTILTQTTTCTVLNTLGDLSQAILKIIMGASAIGQMRNLWVQHCTTGHDLCKLLHPLALEQNDWEETSSLQLHIVLFGNWGW